MKKPIELIRNFAGGIDLITERDSGNEIRIQTGKKDRSLDFWERLRETCDEAISDLEEEPEFPEDRLIVDGEG